MRHAGSLALQDIDAVPADARPHLGRHFAELFTVIAVNEAHMSSLQAKGIVPAHAVLRLDMGSVQDAVRSHLDEQAQRQNALDNTPTEPNDIAAETVQRYLEEAHRQLSQS